MPGKKNSLFKVLGINGSGRGGKGMTQIVVERFMRGAESAGAVTEVLFPAKMKIAPCAACLHCWLRTPGKCRHKDSIPEIMEKIGFANLLVLASPVYVDGMTAQMKAVFDRMITFTPPFFELVGNRSYHPIVHENRPPVVAISTCGFPERLHFDPIGLHFERICQNMRVDLLGQIQFPGSSIIATDPPVVEDNLAAVEAAGREAVESGAISEATLEAANRDYIPDPAAFDDKINEVFHLLRKHHGAEK